MKDKERNKYIKEEGKGFCSPCDDVPVWVLILAGIVLLFLIF